MCPAECKISGGHGGGETPVPIPNTAVKPARADGTWGEAPWESRSPPGFLTKPPQSFGSRGFRTFWALTSRRQPTCRRSPNTPDSAAILRPMPAAEGSADRSRASLTGRRLRVLPMRPRDIDEEHRASTPLELLFDLSFVVAVSQAADQLSAALGLGHFHTAIVSYLLVFFAIWWAWVNFTWFASAYDVDDLLYRLLTFVQIIGVLILAAGVDSAFTAGNFTVMTIGYVVMRIAMVAQWLRAAGGEPRAPR